MRSEAELKRKRELQNSDNNNYKLQQLREKPKKVKGDENES